MNLHDIHDHSGSVDLGLADLPRPIIAYDSLGCPKPAELPFQSIPLH